MNICCSLSSKSNKDSFILIALQRTLHDLQQFETLNIHITSTEVACWIEQNTIQLHWAHFRSATVRPTQYGSLHHMSTMKGKSTIKRRGVYSNLSQSLLHCVVPIHEIILTSSQFNTLLHSSEKSLLIIRYFFWKVVKERNDFIERYNQLISCEGNVRQMKIDINSKESVFFLLYEIHFTKQTKLRQQKITVPRLFFRVFFYS